MNFFVVLVFFHCLIVSFNSLENKNLFYVLQGIITRNKNRLFFKKWLLPLHSEKIFQERRNNKNISCIIEFLGYLFTSNNQTISYQNSGIGKVTLKRKMKKNEISYLCVYMTNINQNIPKKWKPLVREDTFGALEVIIQCPIFFDNIDDSRDGSGDDGRDGGNQREEEKIDKCLDLELNSIEVLVTIYPIDTLLNDVRNSSIKTRNSSSSSTSASIFSLSSSYLLQSSNLSHTSTITQPQSNVILSIQTFSNSISGPSLYMFILYYINLGYGVIIYDTYGIHQPFLQEFIDMKAIDYYPFTVLEQIFPQFFNYKNYKKINVKNFLLSLSFFLLISIFYFEILQF